MLYRLQLAEKLKAPWRRPGKRHDPVAAAAREAAKLLAAQQGGEGDEAQASGGGRGKRGGGGGGSDGLTVTVMLIGLRGEACHASALSAVLVLR